MIEYLKEKEIDSFFRLLDFWEAFFLALKKKEKMIEE